MSAQGGKFVEIITGAIYHLYEEGSTPSEMSQTLKRAGLKKDPKKIEDVLKFFESHP